MCPCCSRLHTYIPIYIHMYRYNNEVSARLDFMLLRRLREEHKKLDAQKHLTGPLVGCVCVCACVCACVRVCVCVCVCVCISLRSHVVSLHSSTSFSSYLLYSSLCLDPILSCTHTHTHTHIHTYTHIHIHTHTHTHRGPPLQHPPPSYRT